MKNKLIKICLLALALLPISTEVLAETESYRGSGRDRLPDSSKAIETSTEFCRGSGCGRGAGRRQILWHSKSAQYWLLEWSVDGGRTYQSQNYNTYDACNNRAKGLIAAGATISKYCLDSWNLN